MSDERTKLTLANRAVPLSKRGIASIQKNAAALERRAAEYATHTVFGRWEASDLDGTADAALHSIRARPFHRGGTTEAALLLPAYGGRL